MKIEHLAIGYNSETEADKFFINLLGLKKLSTKIVPPYLMENFFGINKEQKFVVYGNNNLKFEVFVTNDDSKAKDIFTHACLVIENRNELVDKASSMGFDVVKVPRKDGLGYYLFIKDSFKNLYEIKERV